MWYCMATVPTGGRRRWPVGGSLNYNTVWQLVQFCRKQGKRVEVAYVLSFFSLWDSPDLCPKSIDLDMKLSAPSCPPTLSPFHRLQTEQAESQRNLPLPTPLPRKGCLGLSNNPNWDSKCPSRGPNNPYLSTTSDYSDFNRNSDNRSKRSSDSKSWGWNAGWDGGQKTKR